LWATSYIEKLVAGEMVTFNPKGNSMVPIIKSGQEVVCRPYVKETDILKKGMVVLCAVGRSQYLHLVKAVQEDQVLIGNNRGKINGWTPKSKVYGIKI